MFDLGYTCDKVYVTRILDPLRMFRVLFTWSPQEMQR